MYKKFLSGLLALALVFGSAAALPEGAFEISSNITASAEVSGDYEYDVLEDKTVGILKYNGDETNLVIPSKLGGKKVSTILETAFKGCTNLTRVTIPSGVTSIGNEAFANCKYLESITIPDSVTSIGNNALYNCPRIESVIVPKSVTSIGEKALGYYDDNGTEKKVNWFMICCERYSAADTYAWDNGFDRGFIEGDFIYKYGYSDSMIVGYIGSEANITIPSQLGGKTVTGIRGGSFGSCKSIVSLTIPDTVIVIGDSAFSSCTNLKSITLPNQLDCISRWLFDGCTSLEKITIPSSAQGIGKGAFYSCASLTSVTIPSGVKYLDKEAFKDCTSLKSVTIPGSVTTIDYNVFKNCTSLTSVTIKNGVTAIGYYMFEGCSKLSSVSIPDSVTTIEPYAFFDCTSLKKVTVPKTVETIGTKALGYYHDERGEVIPNVDFIVRCYKDSPADEYAKNNYVKIEYIDVKHVAAKDPTCTAAGNIEYWTWNKKYFSDALCTKEITKAQTVRKATGHNWSAPTWTWSGTTAATAKFTCATDKSHVETVKATISSKTTKATCTADGKTVYTATATFGGKTYTDTKTVTIAKTGHKYSAWKTVAYDFKKNTSTLQRTCSGCSKTETKTVENAITRLKGSGRYATAAAISKGAYSDTASTVILANGNKYADALAGATLAKAYGAPILLTESDKLPSETLAEIKRLKAKKVIILGGSGSVGNEVKSALKKNGLSYEIVKGSSRFETAVKIAEKTKEKTKTDPTEIFFVSSDKFADALSVSAVAAKKDAPIIYLPKTGAIDDVTAAYLKTMKGKVKNAYVIGGSGVIGADVMAAAGKALGLTVDKTIVRVKGSTKYDTCVEVNKNFASVLNGTAICVATGEDFPDALAGGVFSAVKTAPLFLANGSLSDAQKAYLKSKNANSIYVFGGSKSVPDSLVQNIAKASVK